MESKVHYITDDLHFYFHIAEDEQWVQHKVRERKGKKSHIYFGNRVHILS